MISASTGNHGQSIAYAARLFGVRAIICVPEGANPVKVAAMRGARRRDRRRTAATSTRRASTAQQLAAEHGYRYIHSGNEPHLIAGVATAALEMLEDEPAIDVIVVPIGGGSGAAGACIAAKAVRSGHRGDRRAVRCGAGSLPLVAGAAGWSRIAWRRSPRGWRRGSAFELPQRMMREQLDDFILVSDDEIRTAMVAMIETTRNLVEAAGAASLAGALRLRERLAGRRVALVCSGGNVSPAQLEVRREACSPRCLAGGSVRPCRRNAVGDWLPSSVASSAACTSSSASSRSLTHLDEPASLVFWISSLWGGGALVLYGTFGRPEIATRLVVAGALLGFLATVWTLVIPLLVTCARVRLDPQLRPRRGRLVKITGVRTFVVGNPTPGYGGRYFIFLKLETDAGLEGLGEVYVATVSPQLVASMVEDVVARHVAGREPFHIEATWRDVYASGYAMRPDPTLVGVLSGIEMAMWDIVGKAVGKPVYELLGGRVRERLRSYSYLYAEAGDASDVYSDPGLAAERAAEYAALGFTALKFDPAGAYTSFDPRQPSLADLERCERYVAADPRGRRLALRPPVRDARAVHRRGRDSHGPAARALRAALVRGADAARVARGDGARGARDVDPDRDRRAAHDEARVRARARDAGPRRSCR